MQLPPGRIGWTSPGSFGAFTVNERFPKIVRELEGCGEASRSRLENWVASVRSSRIDPRDFDATTPFLKDFVEQRRGLPLSALCFMHLEFLFYHRINSELGAYKRAVDPFKKLKASAACDAASEFCRLRKKAASAAPSLRSAILASLRGNLHDLSQLDTPSCHTDKIVVDHSDALLTCLDQDKHCSRPVALIADNAGNELLSDLVLIDVLLARAATPKVHLHLKRWPMFVSDACLDDLKQQIFSLRAANLDPEARLLADRLEAALADGTLYVGTDADWNEPRDFDALRPQLVAGLASCALVLSKGDLNYRRHFGDRLWDMYTPLAIAGLGIGFRSALLRVCKSEIVVGVPINAPLPSNERWTTDGTTGMIQLFD